MKIVTAIVKPFKLEDAKEALRAAGVHGMTVTEARGFGRQRGHTEMTENADVAVDFVPKVKIEVLCDDADSERVVQAIMNAARTGRIGDGKVFVTAVQDVYRIRTGEAGPAAI